MARLGGEGQSRIALFDGSLPLVPSAHGLRFLHGQRGENQVWKTCVPSQGFRFIQRELKKAGILLTHFGELPRD